MADQAKPDQLHTADPAANPYLSGRYARSTGKPMPMICGSRARCRPISMACSCGTAPRVAIPATVPNGLHANWFPRRH